MSDVKWIKIVTDIFDDEKILIIESLPEADSIIVIWFKLLCLAGKQNNSGVFTISNRFPYTDEMFAAIFRRQLSTIRLALSTFKNLGMIEIIEGTVTIPNWEKHQSLASLEASREASRKRVSRFREKQRSIASGETCNAGCNGGCNVTETRVYGNVTQTDKDIDIDRDKERDKEEEYEAAADDLAVYATNNLQFLSPNNLMELLSFRDSLADDVIRYAIDEATSNGVRAYSYVKAILNNLINDGVKTIGDAKARSEKRKRSAHIDRNAADTRPAKEGNPFEDDYIEGV